jgi:hypothetical protein
MTTTSSTVSAGGGGATSASGGGGASGTGGAGAGGGGTGGSGGQPDMCPGQTVNLAFGTSVHIQGSTVGASNDFKSAVINCGDTTNDSPDVVYQVNVATEGTLTYSLVGSGTFDPSLSLLQDCASGTQLACSPGPVSGKEDIPAGTYTFVIDGSAGSAGDYTFSLDLEAPVCGDGVQNPGEECDTGMPPKTDGCVNPGQPNQCTFKVAPGSDVCPGEAHSLTPAGLSLLATMGNYTTGFTDDYQSLNCNFGPNNPPGGGPDRVYAITPTVSGTMKASVGFQPDGVTASCSLDPNPPTCVDFVLYVRSSCLDKNSELDCSDEGFNTPETISIPVVANQTYFIIVDGFSDVSDDPYGAGNFNLLVTLN